MEEGSDTKELFRSQGAIRFAESMNGLVKTLLKTPTVPVGTRR